MTTVSKKEFCLLANILSKDLSNYIKRGSVLATELGIDVSELVNASFLEKRQQMANSTYVRPKMEGTYYSRNKEKCAAYREKWQEENPEKYAESKNRQRLKNLRPISERLYLCPACNVTQRRNQFTIKSIANRRRCITCTAAIRATSWQKRHANDVASRSTPEYKERQKRKREKRVANGKSAAHVRMKRIEDPLYRFKEATRTTICMAFKKAGFKKTSKATDLLGCDFDFFISHIQSQFEDAMSLSNYGQWHIDHIVPLASAKNIEDTIKLNHYTNLRPLWALDNLKKGSKVA